MSYYSGGRVAESRMLHTMWSRQRRRAPAAVHDSHRLAHRSMIIIC